MAWTNNDGLLVRFGTERPEITKNGLAIEGSTSATEKVFVTRVTDATKIATTDTAASAGDVPYIPAGAVVKDAYFIVDAAFTSSDAGVLDIGFKEADGTNINDAGIDAAIAKSAMGAGAVVKCDGALVGTKLTKDSYVMFSWDAFAFTAGSGTLVIKYIDV